MKAFRHREPFAFRSWLYAFSGACAATLALLCLLVFVHREEPLPQPASDRSGIRLQSIEPQEESSSSVPSSPSPSFAARLPVRRPTEVSPLAVDLPSVDVSVDLSQMLEWRYSYDKMGERSAQVGAFGISNFTEVDQAIQSIVIPPKTFPDELIDAGVLSGRVVVKLMIDESGRVKVMSVLSASHPSLVPPVVEAMNRSVYSIPLRNDRPAKAIINRVIVFEADPQHVAERRSLKPL